MVDFKLPKEKLDLNRIDKVNFIQDKAVECLMDNGGIGTLCMATGVGKTFTAFKYLYKLLDLGLITLGDEIWFLAETTTREKTLDEEESKFTRLYNIHPYKDFNIKFHCYQSKPIGKPIVIIADEIHDSLTPEYHKVYFNNKSTYILGLSATIPKNLKVYRDDENNDLTKGDLIKKIAPIVFNYPLGRAIDDGILSPFNTRVIKHSLDEISATIPDGSKKKSWNSTEAKYYSYRNKIIGSSWPSSAYKGIVARQQCRLLWNLPSKANVVKSLLNKIEGKTIIFGVELKLLDEITDNVVRGGDKRQDVKNNKLINDFNSGKINVIAAAKKLKQGITLEGVTNCIIVSYYKESYHMIQQLGRIIRFVPEKVANLYVFRTDGTYETKWFENMNKERNEKGKVINTVDLNIAEVMLSENILINGSS